MILRAIFWIGLVSFLVPHEPDLGFGRPGSQLSALASAAPSMAALIQASGTAQTACADHKDACAGSLSILDGFQNMAIRSMDAVRADLAANRTKMH